MLVASTVDVAYNSQTSQIMFRNYLRDKIWRNSYNQNWIKSQ